jgi:hypothetical protein
MSSFRLHTLTRSQLREAQADAVKKLAFVRATIKNIPEAYVPFPRLQEISFLEQRLREYRSELARRRKPDAPVRIFYSYARSDEGLLVELDGHLSGLESEGPVEIFWDRDREPGVERHPEIKDELKDADLVLFLASPQFLASRYCRHVELPAVLELHDCGLTTAVPVILRPCAWQETPLGRLQAMPRDGRPVIEYAERGEAWAEVTRAISSVVSLIRQGNPPTAVR